MQIAAIRLPDGTTFQIQDLSLSVLDRIARKHNLSWAQVVDNPVFTSALAAADVLIEVCKAEGIDSPHLGTGRDMLAVVQDWFTTVDDELPEAEEPDPNAVPPTGGETETPG